MCNLSKFATNYRLAAWLGLRQELASITASLTPSWAERFGVSEQHRESILGFVSCAEISPNFALDTHVARLQPAVCKLHAAAAQLTAFRLPGALILLTAGAHPAHAHSPPTYSTGS